MLLIAPRYAAHDSPLAFHLKKRKSRRDRFVYALPGVILPTILYVLQSNAGAEPFKTGNREFDRLFPNLFAVTRVRRRFENAMDTQNEIARLYKKWLNGRHMEIDEERMRLGAGGGGWLPFQARIPGENRYLFNDKKIEAAQRLYLDEMPALVRTVTATVGDPLTRDTDSLAATRERRAHRTLKKSCFDFRAMKLHSTEKSVT